MSSHQKRLWHVQGFEGSAQSLSVRLPIKTSGKEVQTLLQRLAARHLTPAQLVELALQKRTDNLRPTTCERRQMSLEIEDGRYRYMAEITSEFQMAEIARGHC